MITIDEKLYITKEVNNIVVSYAKAKIIRQLLLEFSFEKDDNNKVISTFLENTNFCNGILNPDIEVELIDFIYGFLKKLNKDDTTALYFWTINNLYLKYLEDLEHNPCKGFDEKDSTEVYNFKFGRILAHKLYEPESTALDVELLDELMRLLTSYASEFDLSVINEFTFESAENVIKNYCS